MSDLSHHNLCRRSRPPGLRGFTLIELLLAAALTVLVIGLLLIPLMSGLSYFRSATARADAQTVARNTLDVMTRELAEAAYVQQDMNDNGSIAFAPPLRVNPDDPTSQIVTPPRPDWNHLVRYWRALRDPERNYTPGSRLGVPNTYFLARTAIDSPFATNDPWNRWNDAWATAANRNPDLSWVHYAPLTRVVNTDFDYRPDANGNPILGSRTQTLQPGYPYLAARWLFAGDPNRDQKINRYYRDRVRPLTPDSESFDITALAFDPLVISGEWLAPSADNSVYLARYPLWRLGVPYTSWTALQNTDPVFGRLLYEQTQRMPISARWQPLDPFLLIYRFGTKPDGYPKVPDAIGCFDTRSRTMKVLEVRDFSPTQPSQWLLYDTYQYPARTIYTDRPNIGFSVDWINGSVRFDFPPVFPDPTTGQQVTAEQPQLTLGSQWTEAAYHGGSGEKFYDHPLTPWWEARRDAGPTQADLSCFLLPDTVWVKLNATSNGQDVPGRALTRVNRTPQEYTDQFQLGFDDPRADGQGEKPVYGYLRLPAHLADGTDPSNAGTKLWVYYRWRNNGVMPATGAHAWQEQPDLVCAYYRTSAILDVSLTVTRADPTANVRDRISQSASVTRRVKLRAAVRQVRESR